MQASRDVPVPDAKLTFSHHNWNMALGYGMVFDELELPHIGVAPFARGSQFYAHPELHLYKWPILKLHGSLNWFRYLSTRRFAYVNPVAPVEEPPDELMLKKGLYWPQADLPYHGDWYIDPLIITPVLYKDQYFDREPFISLWSRTRAELASCERLVVIGYSFPPTDFATRELFLEAFSQRRLNELIVVNPNGEVVRRVRELCRFETPLVCGNLDTFVRLRLVPDDTLS